MEMLVGGRLEALKLAGCAPKKQANGFPLKASDGPISRLAVYLHDMVYGKIVQKWQ